MTGRGVGDARQLDQALADPSAAIVVCAAYLPESDGYAVAARLRISTGAGIVMLMPDDRRESRILGLSIGVDNCMSKPVDLDELGMVLPNLQRRQRAKPTPPAPTPEPAQDPTIHR